MLRFPWMQTEHILALLIEERDKLQAAIDALQGPTKRRGRLPGKTAKAAAADYDDPTMPDWVKPKSALAKAAPKKKRRKFSAAQREAASERMRLRWAAKKKAEVKTAPKAAGKAKKTAKTA
jgi:hypothetical protein